MARPVLAVIFGTFTLRLATGITGAMLIYYYAAFPQYGGEPVDPRTVGVLGALFYADRARRPRRCSAILSDRVGHRRIMLLGPGFGAVAVIITAFTVSLPVIGFTRLLEGASTAASVPSILGFIAFATAADEILRGKAVARFEAATLAGLMVGLRPRRAAVPAVRPHGVPAQRRSSTARRSRSTGSACPKDAEPEPAGRSHDPEEGLRRYVQDPARQPRLAPRADLDRHQRDARPVHEPDPVPARPRAEPATSPTSS